MLEIGSLVDNKYKILSKIGQGGMSTVYLAMNERAHKTWAIKEFRKDDVIKSQVSMLSIKTETELLRNLSHPNLPSIADIIDYEGSILIVMDYVEGNTLNKALKEYGAQPQEYVIEWAEQLCDVLQYLHSQDPPIIYRDLKPSNIMLKPDGTIVLIDFGTARQYKDENIEDTTCLGTRGYAAPEQFGGQGQTDARTDIYCLGATMYHLVTGNNPSEPPYEMMPIRQVNPALSKGLEQIIIKCTQNDPTKRYSSARELLYDLEHYYELDKSYRRFEKIKLAIFTITLIISLTCGIGAFVMNHYASAYIEDTYSYLNDVAEKSLDENEDTYIEMIDVDPSRADAYISLVDKVFLEDGNFSEDEATTLRQILITPRDKKTYEQILSEDKAGYALFCYRLGLAYFYSYEETGNKAQSAYWFKKAADGSLNESQTERAKRLGAIADYYVSLGTPDKTGDVSYNYKAYWDDLTAVAEGNITEIDNANTALVIYKELASQICVNASNFYSAGISISDMELQLLNIEQHVADEVDSVEETDRIKELKAELNTNIVKARQYIEMIEQGE